MLILSNIYPVVSRWRVQKKKKATNYCIRFGSLVWNFPFSSFSKLSRYDYCNKTTDPRRMQHFVFRQCAKFPIWLRSNQTSVKYFYANARKNAWKRVNGEKRSTEFPRYFGRHVRATVNEHDVPRMSLASLNKTTADGYFIRRALLAGLRGDRATFWYSGLFRVCVSIRPGVFARRSLWKRPSRVR